MEEEDRKRKSGWMILLYISPLYLLLAYPLYKWHQRIVSEVPLSEDEYKAFASDEGELKKSSILDSYVPDFEDVSFTVGYKTGGESDSPRTKRVPDRQGDYSLRKSGENHYAAKRTGKKAGKRKKTSDIRKREYLTIGAKKGYMTYMVGKVMNNPKVMKALFNNKFVVNGFLQRENTRKALSSPENLINFLTKTNAVNNFLSNSIVKKALNNPSVINTIASSKLANEILNSPAVSGLMNDPAKMNQILENNPELGNLLSNPNIMSALMNNPQTAGALGNLNMGGNLNPAEFAR